MSNETGIGGDQPSVNWPNGIPPGHVWVSPAPPVVTQAGYSLAENMRDRALAELFDMAEQLVGRREKFMRKKKGAVKKTARVYNGAHVRATEKCIDLLAHYIRRIKELRP